MAQPGPFSKPPAYYLKLVTSEYRGSVNMTSWLTANLQMFADITACLATFAAKFNLNTATGQQLDMLGTIVGRARTVPFQPTGILNVAIGSAIGSGYKVGDTLLIIQSGATNGQVQITSVDGNGGVTGIKLYTAGHGYKVANGLATSEPTGGTGFTVNITQMVSPVLSDSDYRILLLTTVFRNHWNGQIDSFQGFWPGVFPGGAIQIQDHQDMSATIQLTGQFSPIMQDMIYFDMIVPRPEGVLYNYTFPQMPYFGFDVNTPQEAGFDLGKFT